MLPGNPDKGLRATHTDLIISRLLHKYLPESSLSEDPSVNQGKGRGHSAKGTSELRHLILALLLLWKPHHLPPGLFSVKCTVWTQAILKALGAGAFCEHMG